MLKLPVRYHLSSGNPVVSVTQVLTLRGRIDTTWFTPESAWRGSEVHRLTEEYDAGKRLVIPKGLEGYVEAYVKFLSTCRPVYAASEVAVTSAVLRLGGRIDRVCQDLLGTAAVLDFKTSQPHAWHGQQLSFYNLLRPTGARWACYLRADGKYKIKHYDDPADHRRNMFDLAQVHGAVTTDGAYWIPRVGGDDGDETRTLRTGFA